MSVGPRSRLGTTESPRSDASRNDFPISSSDSMLKNGTGKWKIDVISWEWLWGTIQQPHPFDWSNRMVTWKNTYKGASFERFS